MSEPNQPAITPAMIVAAIVALIAPVAAALRAFGVYDLSAGQLDALTGLIPALAAFAAVLVAADAYLRGKRNDARATIATGSPVPVEVKALHPQDSRAVSAIGGALAAADEPGDPDALPDMLSTPPDAVAPDGDDRKVATA